MGVLESLLPSRVSGKSNCRSQTSSDSRPYGGVSRRCPCPSNCSQDTCRVQHCVVRSQKERKWLFKSEMDPLGHWPHGGGIPVLQAAVVNEVAAEWPGYSHKVDVLSESLRAAATSVGIPKSPCTSIEAAPEGPGLILLSPPLRDEDAGGGQGADVDAEHHLFLQLVNEARKEREARGDDCGGIHLGKLNIGAIAFAGSIICKVGGVSVRRTQPRPKLISDNIIFFRHQARTEKNLLLMYRPATSLSIFQIGAEHSRSVWIRPFRSSKSPKDGRKRFNVLNCGFKTGFCLHF